MGWKVSGLVFSGIYRSTIWVTSPTYLIRNLRKLFTEQIPESAFSRELQRFFWQGGKNSSTLQYCRRYGVSCCLRRRCWEVRSGLVGKRRQCECCFREKVRAKYKSIQAGSEKTSRSVQHQGEYMHVIDILTVLQFKGRILRAKHD